MDTSMLTLESQQVIALRFLRMTLGGSAAAPREVNRMVAEKIEAIAETAGGESDPSPHHLARADELKLASTHHGSAREG